MVTHTLFPARYFAAHPVPTAEYLVVLVVNVLAFDVVFAVMFRSATAAPENQTSLIREKSSVSSLDVNRKELCRVQSETGKPVRFLFFGPC